MKLAASIIFGIAVNFNGTAQAAKNENLCVYQQVKPGSSVQTDPPVLNREYTESDIEELYSIVRSFEDHWSTPTTIWPNNSGKVTVQYYGVTECQMIFTGASIYVSLVDNNGFLQRPVTIDEAERFLRW